MKTKLLRIMRKDLSYAVDDTEQFVVVSKVGYHAIRRTYAWEVISWYMCTYKRWGVYSLMKYEKRILKRKMLAKHKSFFNYINHSPNTGN